MRSAKRLAARLAVGFGHPFAQLYNSAALLYRRTLVMVDATGKSKGSRSGQVTIADTANASGDARISQVTLTDLKRSVRA